MPASEPDTPLDPAQARIVQRLRWLALGSSAVMLAGFLVVFGVIGYRLFSGAERGRSLDATVPLPKGARVVSTTITEGKLVVTLETGATREVRLFELGTMRPAGRIRFSTEP